jgi:hypothetical protein
MAGVVAEITPAIASAFVPEVWSKMVEAPRRKAQVLAGTVDSRYESEMKSGDILHIRQFPNSASKTKSDNTLVVPDANQTDQQDVTVSSYKYAALNIQSLTQVQSDIEYMKTFAGTIAYALNGSIETDLAALPDDLATNIVGTLGVELTMDDWESIWQKLQLAFAPLDNRFAWLSSAAISAIRKLETPISADFTRSNIAALDNATIGRFMGFNIVESQYLEAPAAGQHDCAAFHRTQFGLIRQKSVTMEHTRSVENLADLTVGWEVYTTFEKEQVAEAAGAVSVDDGFGVYVKTV